MLTRGNSHVHGHFKLRAYRNSSRCVAVQGGSTSAERCQLRTVCSRPAELFMEKGGAADQQLHRGTALLPSPIGSESVGEQKELKMASTDKLASAVIGRVLPYVCNTCMRCSRQAESKLTWCVGAVHGLGVLGYNISQCTDVLLGIDCTN